uniref:Putative homeodomain transcription factor 1 n=1 Tax=Schistocephalus solidus TaxID=70667 RepID=A0A0V0J3P3_SCHSO
MDIGGPISWYQTKIANYDKQTWEKSIEQRILHGLESRPKKESTLNTSLLDVDLIRGTAFARAKPKHDWCAVLRRGFLRSAFPVLYLDYWKHHLSPRLAVYLIFHFFIQLLQVSCFLVVNPLKTHVTEADVVVPLIMGLCLGILHSQITSAHGSHGSISTAGPSAVTVGAADVALASVNGANTVTAAGASAQGNTSGTAEAFLCDQSCLSNCYAGRVSDSIEAFNAQASSSSSKLKKWRCRVSEKSGHKCSVHIKDKPKASATSSSSSSHPLVESENLCDADERANEADEDSCAEENKHYQSNRPSDGDLQLSQAQQQQQQVQTSSKSRSHFLHSRNRKQELSGDALLREAPPDESAVFSRQITQLPSAGHDADVESDFYDLEAKRGDDAEKTGTSENGSFTGVINATDGDAPDPWPIRIKKKRNHVFGTPLVTGSCLRKRSNSLSPGFCFSKFTATTERLSKTVLSLNGRPKEFSVPPPPEDVLQHFKEAKFRGVPDPEVFAEYFEQPNRSPKKLPDLDRQKGLITKPSAGTKLGKKTIDAFKISEGSKRSSEKLQPSSHKKAEFKSERSVRQHAVLPAATKTFIKLEPNFQLIGAVKEDHQTGRAALRNINRCTCSVDGLSNQRQASERGTSSVPPVDFVASITNVAVSDGPRAKESNSSQRHSVTSVGQTKQFPGSVDDANLAPTSQVLESLSRMLRRHCGACSLSCLPSAAGWLCG